MSLRTSAQTLKLSSSATHPHLRLMAGGARAFRPAPTSSIQSTKSSQSSHPAASASASYIKGTVNEPTKFPPPSAAHGSYHWAFERLISVALVPLFAVGAVKHGSSGILDGSIALTLLVHSHIGFDACLADYLHKRKFPIAGPIGTWGLRAATIGALVGLYEFQTNDIGLTELVAKLWTA